MWWNFQYLTIYTNLSKFHNEYCVLRSIPAFVLLCILFDKSLIDTLLIPYFLFPGSPWIRFICLSSIMHILFLYKYLDTVIHLNKKSTENHKFITVNAQYNLKFTFIDTMCVLLLIWLIACAFVCSLYITLLPFLFRFLMPGAALA